LLPIITADEALRAKFVTPSHVSSRAIPTESALFTAPYAKVKRVGRSYVFDSMTGKYRPPARDAHSGLERDAFHDWILSLPWVLERPCVSDAHGVRTFAIECHPLDIRRLWLVTGLPHGCGIALIVDDTRANFYKVAGLATPIAAMPGNHTMIALTDGLRETALERAVLDVYGALLP